MIDPKEIGSLIDLWEEEHKAKCTLSRCVECKCISQFRRMVEFCASPRDRRKSKKQQRELRQVVSGVWEPICTSEIFPYG